MMRVLYMQPSEGACDYYRGVGPLQKAMDMGFLKVKFRNPHNLARDAEQKPEEMSKDFSSDIIVVPRLCAYDAYESIVEMAKLLNPKVKMVTDFDDNVFEVSPLSPHYREFGTEEAFLTLPNGEQKKIWQDKVNIDLKANRARIKKIKKLLGTVSVCTTTSGNMAYVLDRYCKNVEILPNCVDLNEYDKPDYTRGKEIRLVWSGGATHYEDWYQIKEPVNRILKKYPNVKLVMFGSNMRGALKDMNKDQLELHDWLPFSAYPYKLNLLRGDIGLIPLRETRFNVCKSPIKWIENGALKIPSVATHITPYKEMADLSKDNGIYVRDNDPKAWFDGIEYLINSPIVRAKMGYDAYLDVKKHFDLNTQCHKWAKVYEEVMKWQAPQPQHSQQLSLKP